jgi:hypothetical protein
MRYIKEKPMPNEKTTAMKKALLAAVMFLACPLIFPAVITPVTPTADVKIKIINTGIPEPITKTTLSAAASPAAVSPAAQPTPHLSAIEIYRQMTGRKAERVFPKPTPEAAAAAVNIQAPYPAAQSAGPTTAGWFLLASDAALTGWAIFALMDQNNAVDSYERLKAQLNVPPYANYDFLVREQEKANSKMTVTTIAWSLAGVCLAYTAADALWFHSAFPVAVRSAYDPATGEVTAYLNARF